MYSPGIQTNPDKMYSRSVEVRRPGVKITQTQHGSWLRYLSLLSTHEIFMEHRMDSFPGGT